MKLKNFSKKCLVLLLVFSMLGSFSAIGTSAANSDDGVLLVITKNSKKYFGTVKSDFCTEYVSANGDNDNFYRYLNADINLNDVTDICDLVALNNAIIESGKGIDFNFDSVVDNKDINIVRQIILGETDFEIQ